LAASQRTGELHRLAAILIDEPVGLVTVAGGALVVGGVALVQRASPGAPPTPAARAANAGSQT
jgi:drug/metabolite transporter (DMT)-like permease